MRHAGLGGEGGQRHRLGGFWAMGQGLRSLPMRLLALGAALLLLAAFHAVVRGVVVQGDARRAATVRQSDAAAACQRLPGRERRIRCRAGIG